MVKLSFRQEEFRKETVIQKKGDVVTMIDIKDIIIHLKTGLIKIHCIKWINTFLKHMNALEETLMLKLIYLIKQQKQI